MATSALVLFSGGQDSTVCLAWALSRFARVETVGFDYGQRHRTELEARPRILQKLKSGFPDWASRQAAQLIQIQTYLLPRLFFTTHSACRAMRTSSIGSAKRIQPRDINMSRRLLLQVSTN